MNYLVRCIYRPGGDLARLPIRAEHIRHMLRWLPQTVFGAALFDDLRQRHLGMVVALTVAGRADAEQFISTEPYSAAGLFASIEITELRLMTPPHTPDLLEGELAKELALIDSPALRGAPNDDFRR